MHLLNYILLLAEEFKKVDEELRIKVFCLFRQIMFSEMKVDSKQNLPIKMYILEKTSTTKLIKYLQFKYFLYDDI